MEHHALHYATPSLQTLHQSARRAFVHAAHDGDVDSMEWLWRLGVIANVDCRGEQDGCTALLHAARNVYMEVAQFVLTHGASIENEGNKPCRPLHAAAAGSHVEMMDLLCRFGADVNAAAGKTSRTALHVAVERKATRAIAFLLTCPSIDVLPPNASGETVLWRASATGNMAAVTLLVETLEKAGLIATKHALVNAPRWDKSTPLLMAAARGDVRLVAFLIAHGANVETKNVNGCTPLYAAILKNHQAVGNYLLTSGADTETMNAGGSTLLIFAAKQGLGSFVDLLLDHGAAINHRNRDGHSALHAAAFEGHTAIVKSLLDHGADPEIRTNEKGWTPLLYAAQCGHDHVARLLIDHGAEIDCQGYDNFTALTMAAWKGKTAICALLLRQGCSVSLRARDGQTALHVAAFSDRRDIIRLLLTAGADRKARDIYGRTAAYMALMGGHFETAELVDTREAVYDNDIWPRHILCELYGLTTTMDQQVKPHHHGISTARAFRRSNRVPA